MCGVPVWIWILAGWRSCGPHFDQERLNWQIATFSSPIDCDTRRAEESCGDCCLGIATVHRTHSRFRPILSESRSLTEIFASTFLIPARWPCMFLPGMPTLV